MVIEIDESGDDKIVIFRSNERDLRALSKLAQAIRIAEDANKVLEEVLNDAAVREITGEENPESDLGTINKPSVKAVELMALDLIGDVIDYDNDRGYCPECHMDIPDQDHDEMCPWSWLRQFHDRFREPRGE
jgi:hypothetical protein